MITPSLNIYSANTRKNIKTNKTAKGYILNTRIKNSQNFDVFDKNETEFLLSDNFEKEKEPEKEKFDEKKILKPVLLTCLASLGTIGAISLCALKYSSFAAKSDVVVRPPDLARNFNIKEEHQFALYRALRDPNSKNILGLIGVGLMSAVTLCAKTFTNGVKDIWVKKQKCDIEYDFEKDSIDIETKAFSGKLKVIDELYIQTSNYLKSEINGKNSLNFKGEKKKNEKNDETKKPKNPFLLAALGAMAFVGGSYLLFKTYQKTVKNLDTFYAKTTDNSIKAQIQDAINLKDKNSAIEKLSNVLKTINATEQDAREKLGSIQGITEEEIKLAIKDIQNAQTYVKAPEALGGISEKIQYYCYIDEDRGHLYNWILNPENKFNKYLFLSFSSLSSIGYLANTAAEAVKSAAVEKENKKSDLNLKKNLVEVEIANFKAKKQSAIEPMIENFKIQKAKGKSKEELEEIAGNILFEIKNGPPYVYD